LRPAHCSARYIDQRKVLDGRHAAVSMPELA
jgi:hypothetical protein